MRIPGLASVLAVALIVASAHPAMAQWTWNKTEVRGLFGERILGEPIEPRSRPFLGSLLRGPSGNFLGRNPYYPGMLFPAPPPVEFLPSRPPIAAEPPALPAEAPQVPQLQGEIQGEGVPDIWFRSQSAPEASGSPGVTGATPPRTAPAASGRPRLAPQLSSGVSINSPRSGLQSVDHYLSHSLSEQISAIPRFQTGSPITVSVSGGTATVRGTVATQHDSKVLAELIRLEPGVWNVDNRLTVEDTAQR